jgi:hypothetical protein
MNERIRELAEQCWDRRLDGLHFDREQFAELIVRECAEVCASIAAVRAGYNDADGRDTADSCGDQIKEHFGVER